MADQTKTPIAAPRIQPPPAPPNIVRDPRWGQTRAMERENKWRMEQWQRDMAAWRRLALKAER
ncbi:MAG TPA: hypothetical protein VMZ50_11720 [Phycisphaerae bacterium]|nr:hypothetical protein [Phycisphaerae bacterium]